MSFVKFKKLNREVNLPEAIVDGHIYFVKDVQKIYVDFDAERKSYSLSDAEVAKISRDEIDDSLEDVLAALEAVEAKLNPEVENNYRDLLATLKTIGSYATRDEVQSMVNAAKYVENKVTGAYGAVSGQVIQLNPANNTYYIDATSSTSYSLDASKLPANYDHADFTIVLYNPKHNKISFTGMTTLDTMDVSVYTNTSVNYTLLSVKGVKVAGKIVWTLSHIGSW